jgi:hypothetical protein
MRWMSKPVNWFIATEALGVLTTLILHLTAFIRADCELRRTANFVLAITAVFAFLPLIAAGVYAGVQRLTRKDR